MADPLALLTGSGGALVALGLFIRYVMNDRTEWRTLYLESRKRTDEMPELLRKQAEASQAVIQDQGEKIAELARVVHAQNRGLEALAKLQRRNSDRPGAYRLRGDG